MSQAIDKLGNSHQTSRTHVHTPLRTYYIIFAWLMGLLGLTVLASLCNLDKLLPGLNVIVALIIAFIKAGLVVIFFMHVKDASKLTWAFASAAFLWLAIMLALTFNDYATRNSLPNSPAAGPPSPASRLGISQPSPAAVAAAEHK